MFTTKLLVAILSFPMQRGGRLFTAAPLITTQDECVIG